MSIGLATNTYGRSANTLSSPKIKVHVAAPSKEDLIAAERTARLNRAMGVLNEHDSAAYRTIFAAQQKGDWSKADLFMAKLSDKRLIPTVMADRFERRGATGEELATWLKAFSSHPEAESLYAKALKAGLKNPPAPSSADAWSGNGEVDSAANFSPDSMVQTTAPNSDANRIARSIRSAIRSGKPEKARDILLAAQADQKLVGTFAADAEAVIAESYFRNGEYGHAAVLANAAATANQPLGLWIKGLLCWEKKDYAQARLMFARLADHPALNDSNRAAALFWAYRSEAKDGSRRQARDYLEQAASVPRSFYGLLATQLLGRDPSTNMAKNEAHPKWNARYKALLAESPAGWRALALVQIGENEKAEAELRRLNPSGNSSQQHAMLALADYVPMPALALQLASLTSERGFDPMSYPLLPWQPSNGFSVDRALLFALARHESMLDPTAVSVRGARGLMQIMPATADGLLAKDAKLSAMADSGMLHDPAFNMALGQKYVQHLAGLPEIGNNLIMILAAYNGGPSKAVNWLRGKEAMDPLLFMESIPVRETRNYVARVLPHYWAYRVRLGRSTTALKELAEGKWPQAPLTDTKSVRMADASKL